MNSLFMESLDLKGHPIKKFKKKMRGKYFLALTYIVSQVTTTSREEEKRYINERLKIYQEMLFSDVDIGILNPKAGVSEVRSCMNWPWRRKIRCMLICDVSLILLYETLIMQALAIIKICLSSRNQAEVDCIFASFSDTNNINKKYLVAEPLINQYRLNKRFLSQKERRVIVTANMSAGKSTLINALIGKPLARTSQEVCTGNVCYLFNKAFEDDQVHLLTEQLTMNATADELRSYEWSGRVYMASYFAQREAHVPRLCVIDTPGVDAALYKKHTDITRNALQNEEYDMVLYVVCPTNLGTDAEIRHLRWVAKNLRKEKMVFVLNKLDNYRDSSDSIEESVQGLKDDLLKIGFENPVICPISAYFAYLLKLKMTGQQLSDDEMDDYVFLSKKFMRSSYDLSQYYSEIQPMEDESEEENLCRRAGLYGLEKIIYGG